MIVLADICCLLPPDTGICHYVFIEYFFLLFLSMNFFSFLYLVSINQTYWSMAPACSSLSVSVCLSVCLSVSLSTCVCVCVCVVFLSFYFY